MVWGSRSRKVVVPPSAVVGLDVNATRVRAAYGAADGTAPRGLLLDEPRADLPMAVSLEARTPVVGRPGLSLIRRLPHAVCGDFLPALGHDRVWTADRHRLNAAGALVLVSERLRPALSGQHAMAIAVPPYLTVNQVALLSSAFERARLPVLGTVTIPVAIVASYADENLGVALVVDVDCHALTWTVMTVDDAQARALATIALPTLCERVWQERLLNAVSDRCVRLCRRDPRESAAAEQALWEQIDVLLDPDQSNHALTFSVRTNHWFQNVSLQPDEVTGFCASLARTAAEGMHQALAEAHEVVPATAPPRVVWVTHSAARMPGLVSAVAAHLPESAAVRVLQADAIAYSAHGFARAWAQGDLPRVHQDATSPLHRHTPAFGREHLHPTSVKVAAPKRRK